MIRRLLARWYVQRKGLRKRFRPGHGYIIEIPLDPRDRLLGPVEKLDAEVIDDEVRSSVPMPEGLYPCTVTVERWVSGRRRGIRRHVGHSATVELDTPIPEPGKGENSWDLDDDATYSATVSAATVAGAAAEVGRWSMERRERYASRDWTPDAGWPDGRIVR